MSIHSVSAAERRYVVTAELASVLEGLGLGSAAPTSVVADRILRRLGLTDKADRNAVLTELVKIAPTHPNATHNGRTTMRFGRTVTGYLWHAGPQVEGSVYTPEKAPPPVAKPTPCPPHPALAGLPDDWEPGDETYADLLNEIERFVRAEVARLNTQSQSRDGDAPAPEEW